MVVATDSSRDCSAVLEDEQEPTQHGGDGDGDGDGDGGVLDRDFYVDRYRILDVIGTGGIGVVYAAFDEALGRNVALKLLRPSARSTRKLERRRARLMREAQALARLSHPNVVPIYEVGVFEDRVFLAMEYVEGETMRRWLRSGTRSATEILDKYMQAGRGLAAAHRADIVHRDFKPDNVIVGQDERVRVLDFGLATPVPEGMPTGRYATIQGGGTQGGGTQVGATGSAATTEDIPVARARPKSPPQLSESTSLITGHGKIMGTPAYMSPEQGRGDPIDARADQYSFCVSLWEALFGERPHGPPTATARIRLTRRLAEHGHAGKDVPQSVQRALERGLSIDPEHRFASMDDLLGALAPKPVLWRRWAVAGLIVAASATALGIGMVETNEVELCPREDQALVGIWDAKVREQIGAQLIASERSYASATWGTIARALDDWSGRWLDARVDACTDTKVRNAQSQVLFDVRMACLDRQLSSLAIVTETLAATTPSAADVDTELDAALAAVRELPDPARCERSALIGGALLSEEPGYDDRLEPYRQQLARAHGLLDLAKPDAALEVVDGVISLTAELDARERATEAVIAEAKLLRGRILAASDQPEAALHELRRALFLAQSNGHDTVTVEACAALVELLGAGAQLDQAEDWAELGRATLERLGGDSRLEANLRLASAGLADARGDTRAAAVELRRVVELREQLFGSEHVEVARALDLQAQLGTRLGEYADAELALERALTILTAEFGVTHPEVGLAHLHMAALARARGQHAAALPMLRDALAIFELAHGQQHARVIETYLALADVQLAIGELQEARASLDSATRLVTDADEHVPLDAAREAEIERLRAALTPSQ